MSRTSAILLIGFLTACVTPSPTPSPAASDAPSATTSAAPPSRAPTPTASPIGIEPGAPFDAVAILDAMRASRRPGGVPDEIETPEIAAAVADAIWTVDGTPWATLTVGGACASATSCTLEVGGAHGGALGEDLWVFTVDPSTSTVGVETTTLRSLDLDLVRGLDLLARDRHPLPDEAGLVSASVRWRPPPEEGQFELSYRSGDEVGCALELVVDLRDVTVVEISRDGC